MLWERAKYQHITFSSFDMRWLGGVCAPVTVTPPVSLPAGTATEVTVRVVSQNDKGLPSGWVSLKLPSGWSAPSVTVPTLKRGQGATARVPVTIPATPGTASTTATYLVRGTQRSYGDGTLTVSTS
ncbi:NEW3 domain-containing protein [Streptomyces sp. NPDC056628]|uniref:NEW3 domain-containing protein n=1 Tax=Streptomyces sp. NPDC056628 TaxID=3345882 RepID=UPI0036A4AE02